MECSLDTSNFLEEISSFSHSILFYSLHCSLKKAFFLSCYSLELCIQMGISYLFSLAFSWLLEGTDEGLCTQWSSFQEKEAVTPQRLSQTCLWVFGSLWRRHGLTVLAAGSGSPAAVVLRDTVCWNKYFWRMSPLPLPLWPQLRCREEKHPHSSAENWIKDLLRMALPTRATPRFPHSQSLPSRSLHKPLILIHQRADRMKTTITEN